MEREHERSREEEEKLHKEVRGTQQSTLSSNSEVGGFQEPSLSCLCSQNSRYREEVLDLSSRNLQLSNDNAELSARLRGDQQSVQMLQERLATVSKGQDEEAAMVRQLSSPQDL